MKDHLLVTLWQLLILFESLCGLIVGVILVLNPTGSTIGLPMSLLVDLPLSDFLIPGLIIFIMLGIYPAIIFYGLIFRVNIRKMDYFNMARDQHWSWASAIYFGVLLAVFMSGTILLVGNQHVLQVSLIFQGVLIALLAIQPSVKSHYSQ